MMSAHLSAQGSCPVNLVNDYFQENLALLKEYHPQAWQAVVSYTGKPTGEFCFAADGKVNLFIPRESGAGIFLHDNSEPEKELAAYYELVSEDCAGVVLFVGMGLGYAPLAMIGTRRRIRHLAVLEPETGIFVQALHALDLSALLTEKGVVIAVGPDIDMSAAMAPMGRALVLENLHILRHLASFYYSMETYQSLYDEVYKLGNTLNVSGATTRTFGRKFNDNRFSHLSSIHHQQLLEHIQNAFAGVPAIMVAAGPSLNKNIDLLAQAKGKAVIIAVDTALPALLAHGVEPDFMTAIDMQDIVIEKIVDVSASVSETSLVCASWVSPTIPKNFPARQVYWTFAAKHMESWLNGLLGGKVLTAGAGTVAHLSFTTAVMLGCSPIVFVGQDLAFAGRDDHARHTSLTQKDELEYFYGSNSLQWVEGYGGVKVPTTRGWLSDKHHFEQLIRAYSDREFINATEGGVRIEGTIELTLQDTLARYCQEDVDVVAFFRESDEKSRMPGRGRMIDEFRRLLKSISDVEKDMGRLRLVVAKLKKEVSPLRRQGGVYTIASLPQIMRRQINELDALNDRLDKAAVWTLLDEVTMDGLHQSERLNHEIDRLEEKPELYLDWFVKNIERFELINQCRMQVLMPFKQQLKHLHDYLRREDLLSQKLAKSKSNLTDHLLELLRLYCGNGDHVLMEKLIQERCPDHQGSAELSFYLGLIAAHRSQFDRAEQFFSQALTIDPCWSARIEECRQRLGDQYLGFGREWQVNDRSVALRMLFKGIRHCAGHSLLREALIGQAGQVLSEAEAAAGEGALGKMEEVLGRWSNELRNNANLVAVLEPKAAAALHRFHGNIMVARQDYAAAIESFAAAIALTPEEADLHLLLSDVYFSLADFTAGVGSLDRAVALDRRYAQYWENMGDNLFGSEQVEDAIAAYERCLLALPEHLSVLRKLGDCYMKIDQPQAALEAYSQFKSRVEQVQGGAEKSM